MVMVSMCSDTFFNNVKISGGTQKVSEKVVSVTFYGSKEWADGILKRGIEVCNKRYDYGIYDNRVFEVKYYIRLLCWKGYGKHAKVLGDWLFVLYRNHRSIKKDVTCTVLKKVVVSTWDEFLDYVYG